MGNNRTNPYGVISQQKAEFIVSKIEDALDRLIEDREVLQKKANWTLGIIGGAITLGVGQLLDSKSVLKSYEPVLVIELIILILIGITMIVTCLLPKKYAIKGGDCRILMDPQFMNQKLPYLLIGYGMRLQEGIDLNQKQLKWFSRWIKSLSIAVIVSPMISYLISLIWNQCQ